MEGKTTISTAQMVTFLEAGCVYEATPLHAYLHGTLPRPVTLAFGIWLSGRAGQHNMWAAR